MSFAMLFGTSFSLGHDGEPGKRGYQIIVQNMSFAMLFGNNFSSGHDGEPGKRGYQIIVQTSSRLVPRRRGIDFNYNFN